MHPDISISHVALETEESNFLKARRDEELPLLLKSVRFFAVLSVIVVAAFGLAMYLLRKYSGEIVRPMNVAPPDILSTCIKGLSGLFAFVALISYYSFSKTLKKVLKDIKQDKKTIEPCLITRKVYMKENDRCYVFLSSNVKLSIELSPADFRDSEEGALIFIAYSTHAQVYFGYHWAPVLAAAR